GAETARARADRRHRAVRAGAVRRHGRLLRAWRFDGPGDRHPDRGLRRRALRLPGGGRRRRRQRGGARARRGARQGGGDRGGHAARGGGVMRTIATPRVLLIDNHDSFTWNLVQALGILGAVVTVRTNDAITVEEAAATDATHLVISPGPGRPERAGAMPAILSRLM